MIDGVTGVRLDDRCDVFGVEPERGVIDVHGGVSQQHRRELDRRCAAADRNEVEATALCSFDRSAQVGIQIDGTRWSEPVDDDDRIVRVGEDACNLVERLCVEASAASTEPRHSVVLDGVTDGFSDGGEDPLEEPRRVGTGWRGVDPRNGQRASPLAPLRDGCGLAGTARARDHRQRVFEGFVEARQQRRSVDHLGR